MEYPHDHTLAVQNGYGGYPQVHFFFPNLQSYTAVLRQLLSAIFSFAMILILEIIAACSFSGRFRVMQYAVYAVSDL